MKKVIEDTKVSFYDEKNNNIMNIDFVADECVWTFSNSDTISITNEDELFDLLKFIMSQQYEFSTTEELKCSKTDNRLVWYSDCYYELLNEISKRSVSYLTIDEFEDKINLTCTKPIDEVILRNTKSHVIAFSPSGNGRYAKNINSNSTLQTDFVLNIYHKLLEKPKIKKYE